MRAWRLTNVAATAALFAVATLTMPACAAPKSGAKGKAQEARNEKPDPRTWALVRVDDTLVLRFGPPRVSDPVFAVSCQPGAQLIQFTVETASGKLRAGDGVALALSAGKRRLELAASTFRGATEGRVVVEAAVSLDARVIDLLSDGDTLVARMPGASETYPLAGAKAKLQDFRKACTSGR